MRKSPFKTGSLSVILGLLWMVPLPFALTDESGSFFFTPVSTASDVAVSVKARNPSSQTADLTVAENPIPSDIGEVSNGTVTDLVKPRPLQVEKESPLVPTTFVPAAGSVQNGVDAVAETAQLVEGGKDFLDQKNWPEAKTYYEKALKKYPEDASLRRAYLISRSHLEVENRYHDASFCHFLAKTNKEEILALCDDVLKNIQTWHVDAPDWKILFQSGMESFRIALTEEAFLRQNRVPVQYDAKLPQYGDELLRYSQSWSIHDREELKAAMLKIAESVQKNTDISGISVIMEILCGMVNSLDSYSAYLTSGQINDVYSMIDGHFVGLGVYIESKWKDESLLISKVIPQSPAAMAGLVDGDLISRIDGRNVTDLGKPEEAGALLQGPEETKVVLRVRSKDGSDRDVVVLRRSFDIPSVEGAKIVESSVLRRKVGFFRINTFQKTTVDEVRTELARLQSVGMECLIIDLRNNPGGLLDQAVELSDLFLSSGTIVKTRGRMSERVETADTDELCRVPLILLIDENSASAAEIFAGAMQENGRGLVVGGRSFGKGTVQVIIQLGSARSDELIAGLRLTTEKFYSPLGRSYSGVGVIPDVDVTGEYSVARPAAATAAAVVTAVSLENAPNADVSQRDSSRETVGADVCLARALSEADRVLRNQSRPIEQFSRRTPSSLQ